MNRNYGKMKSYLKAIFNLCTFGVGVLICIFILPKIIFFFMPFIVGWIIALIANPLVRFFERKLKIRRKAGSAVVIVAVLAIVIIAGYSISVKIVEETVNFMGEVPDLWASAQKDFAVMGDKLGILFSYLPEDFRVMLENIQGNLMEYLGEFVSGLSAPTFEAIGRFAKNLPSIIVSIVMGLLSSYFFVAEREYITTMIPRLMPRFLLKRWTIVKNGCTRAIGGYLKAQLKIELWVYILMVIGFLILDVKYTLLIALGIAALDFLPFFGTGLILIPWAFIKFLNADYKMFIGLLIVWGVGQLVRQIIQPKIVGDSMGMAPVPTLFLLFIGYRAAGFLGMIIAVPIGIILVNLYEEGAFDTTKKSLKILFYGVNNFRRINKEDMAGVGLYEGSGGTESRQEKGRKDMR